MTFKGMFLEGNNLIEMIEVNNMKDSVEWFINSYKKVSNNEPSNELKNQFCEFKEVTYSVKKVRKIFPMEEKEVTFKWGLF